MKLAQLKSVHLGQKVDHPLAKYNSKGDLYCLLCNNLIKNANVWKIHLSSKTHKENMILFKAGKSRTNDSSGIKRAASKVEAPPRSLKKAKPSDPILKSNSATKPDPSDSACSSAINKSSCSSSVKTGILKASSKVVPKLPEGFVPKSRLKQSNVVNANTDQNHSKSNKQMIRETEQKSNLPSGFFDENVAVSVEQLEDPKEQDDKLLEDPERLNKPTSNIPDGFFDDAREDAKARKVEYKDPQQLEWEKFQDEMEQEDVRYNTILEEDDQKLREEREIDIGFEQKLWDYRVESMAESVKTGEICPADKDAFVKKLGKVEKTDPDEVKMELVEAEVKQEMPEIDVKMEEDEAMSSDDEYDDVMDWRIKKGL